MKPPIPMAGKSSAGVSPAKPAHGAGFSPSTFVVWAFACLARRAYRRCESPREPGLRMRQARRPPYFTARRRGLMKPPIPMAGKSSAGVSPAKPAHGAGFSPSTFVVWAFACLARRAYRRCESPREPGLRMRQARRPSYFTARRRLTSSRTASPPGRRLSSPRSPWRPCRGAGKRLLCRRGPRYRNESISSRRAPTVSGTERR